MSNKVLLKKSSVALRVPTTSDIDYGELALNYTDGNLYFKNSSNAIKKFVNDGGSATHSDITITGGTADGVAYLNGSKVLTTGSALTFNGASLGIGSSSYGDAGTITASIGVPGTTAGGLQLWAGSAQEHYIQWGDSTSGSATYSGAISYSHATDFMRFWTSSTEQMRLTSTGRLGIGTSSPTSTLSVEGTFNVKNFSVLDTLGASQLFGGTSTRYTLFGNGTGSASILFYGHTHPTQAQNAEIRAGNAIRMKFDSSGNIGIGNTTPATLLSIGSGAGSGGYGGGVYLNRGASAYNFYEASDGTNSIIFGLDNTLSNAKIGSVNSYPIGFYTGNQERARIGSDGTFGIGTTSALNDDGNLAVAGSIGTGQGATNTVAQINIWETTSGNKAGLWFGAMTNQNTGVIGSRTATGNIAFQTYNGGWAERMRIDGYGNVGIGTTSPTSGYMLDVTGKINTQNRYALNGRDTIAREDSNKNIIIGDLSGLADSYITFRTVNSERACIDSSGNLGLGVTPGAWGSPFSSVMQFTKGSIACQSNSVMLFNNAYYDGSNYRYVNTAGAGYYEQTGGQHIWNRAASGTAGNAVTFIQAMTLDASGNLFIGLTGYPSGFSSGRVFVKQASADVFGGFVSASSANDSTISMGINGSIGVISVSYGATAGYKPLAFYTSDTERVRIDSSGNFGIGTSSPAAKLHVSGDAVANTFKLIDNTTVSGSDATIFRPADNTMAFSTNGAERMRLTANGGLAFNGASNYGTAGYVLQSNGDAAPTWVAPGSSSTAALTSTYVGYGSGSNTLTGSAALTFDGSNLSTGNGGFTANGTTSITGFRAQTTSNYAEIQSRPDISYSRVLSSAYLLDLATLSNQPILFTINSSEQMRLTSTGLGIGTTSPSRRLSLDGGAGTQTWTGYQQAGTEKFVVGLDASGNPSLYGTQNAPMIFYTNNAERARIDSSGNFTLGNAVAGTNRVFNINGVANKAGRIVFQESGTDAWLIGNGAASENGNFEIYSATGNNFVFTRTGNLGIGISSPVASAAKFLQIAGATSSELRLQTTTTGTTVSDGFGVQMWSDSNVYLWNYENSATIFGTNGTERVRIDSSGNLGIGTSAPASLFHISGANPQTRLQYTGTAGAFETLVNFVDKRDVVNAAIGNNLEDDGVGTAAAHLVFKTANAGTLTQRMRITSVGDVNIYNGKAYNSYNPSNGRYGSFYTDVQGTVLTSWNGSGEPLFLTSPTGTIRLSTNGSERVRIDTSGNVGIGTSAPGSILEVRASVPIITISPSGYTNQYQTTLGTWSGAQAFLIFGNNGQNEIRAGRTTAGGYLDFFTNNTVGQASASDGNFVMRMAADSNVGIGTVSTNGLKLAIKGSNAGPATSGTTQTGVLRLTGGTGLYNVLDMGVNESTDTAWIQATRANNLGTYDKLSLNPNGGNVGIGTNNPTESLYIQRAGTQNLVFLNQTSSASVWTGMSLGYNGSEYFAAKGNVNTGEFQLGGKNASGYYTTIYSNNAETMRIAAGNVGIGTTSPASKLHVAGGGIGTRGAIRISDEGGGNYWEIGRDNTSTGNFTVNLNATEFLRIDNSGSTTINSTTDGIFSLNKSSGTSWNYINFKVAGSRKFYFGINASNEPELGTDNASSFRVNYGMTVGGNVGIGTTAPISKLHVAGAGNTTGGNIHMGDNTDGSQKWTYLTGAHYNGATNPTGFALIGGLSQSTLNAVVIGGNVYETNPATEIQFWTHTATTHATGGTQRMIINGSGNVGIGTTSPGYKLEVNGSFAATTKSFVIDHPTKSGMKLRYGSLEGPENGVYVRGRLRGNKIELPEYWTKLVDPDSITVNLTAIGKSQNIYVEDIIDNVVYIGGKNVNCFYTVYAERIDVDKLEVEIE